MISQQDYIEYPLFLKYLIRLNCRKLRQPGFRVTGFTKILQNAPPCACLPCTILGSGPGGGQGRKASPHLRSPTGKARCSQETPTRGEHPVPEDPVRPRVEPVVLLVRDRQFPKNIVKSEGKPTKGGKMKFPKYRARRLRKNDLFRRMIRETHLRPDDLILPLFVRPGKDSKQPISSMPGHSQLSIDLLIKEVKEAKSLGIPGVILFGIPQKKDEMGSEAYAEDGIIQKAIRQIKEKVEGILVITDVCLCEYTSHGHCGVVEGGRILNDETLDLLARQALSHARAGADIVAPSDMMDGRVGAIRKILDENQFEDIPIMAYSAKYASSFYGPFRVAAESKPQFGDRKSYQMDPANGDEALREVRLDLEEGADLVMVKPALPYLDIIYRVKQTFNIPVAAYNVSGEFAIVKAASQLGWVDGEQVMMESLISIKRAGADLILTYFAKEAARKLR